MAGSEVHPRRARYPRLAGYYCRFIREYGTIAEPLMKLIYKGVFRWCAEAEGAFGALKRVLTSALVLQLPDFNTDFIMECNASATGFGALLHQGSGPVAFYSKAIAPRHAKLATYE
jgi:hypothetical protein